jgi:hypothetical protein
MPFNPYGVSGSIITPPRQVRTSKAWRRQYPRKAYFTDLVVRDKAGNIIVAIEDSPAVKLAKRVAKNAKPKDTTPKPLTELELRRIALDERRRQFEAEQAENYRKLVGNYN